MHNYKKELGKSLRKWRLANGVTQEQLAFDANVATQTISAYECGNTTPSINTLFKMVNALKISFAQLFAFDNEYLTIEDKELQYILVEKFKDIPHDKRRMIFKIIDAIISEPN